MTSAGAWLDVLIAALVLAALAWLLRTWEGRTPGGRTPGGRTPGGRTPGGRIPGPRTGGGRRAAVAGALARRFGGYYRPLVRQAGFDPAARRGDYWLAKLAAAVLLPMLVAEALAAAGAGGAAGRWLAVPALAGFLLPDLWLAVRRRRRRRRVARSLPYFVDLMVAFLYSGLGLVEAFRRAGAEGFPGRHPLAREVALIGRELDAGQDPGVAFRDLADRTGVADLHAVASALRIGLRLGAPVQETLRTQAEALWTKRREDALRQIHRAEVQVMFPVMLASFPVFGVLAFFPLLVDFLDLIGEVSGLM